MNEKIRQNDFIVENDRSIFRNHTDTDIERLCLDLFAPDAAQKSLIVTRQSKIKLFTQAFSNKPKLPGSPL